MIEYDDLDVFKGIDIELEYKNIIEESCSELSQDITKTALQEFEGKGDYARSWTFKIDKDKLGDYSGVVYNKEHYQLTHLLENGHVSANQYGTYGRVAPHQHIKPCFDKIKSGFIDRMNSCTYIIRNK